MMSGRMSMQNLHSLQLRQQTCQVGPRNLPADAQQFGPNLWRLWQP